MRLFKIYSTVPINKSIWTKSMTVTNKIYTNGIKDILYKNMK